MDHEDYNKQKLQGMLLCPECGKRNIHKVLSPVALHKGEQIVQSSLKTKEDITPPEIHNALESLKSLQKYVEKNFEDVGTKLAEKSLKMHYGIEEPRNIRGVASEEEEKILKKEGIELLKIPLPIKNDKNLN